MSYNTIICEQNRETEIHYELLGSYQGDWLLFTKKDGKYLFREGGYGSCSGCDAYEGTFDYDEKIEIDSEKVINFVEGYKVSKEFTIEELTEFQKTNPLLYGFIPFNTGGYREEGYDQAIIKGLEACILDSKK